VPCIRYSYRTGVIENILVAPTDGMPSLDDLMEMTHALVPTLGLTLEVRHNRLRILRACISPTRRRYWRLFEDFP
jgi:hypothetical protein